MRANNIKLDRIKGCKCEYVTSSLGVSYLVKACKLHKNTFYPKLINAMSKAQESIIKSQPAPNHPKGGIDNIEFGVYSLDKDNKPRYKQLNSYGVDRVFDNLKGTYNEF